MSSQGLGQGRISYIEDEDMEMWTIWSTWNGKGVPFYEPPNSDSHGFSVHFHRFSPFFSWHFH